jgi:hypothetical protein
LNDILHEDVNYIVLSVLIVVLIGALYMRSLFLALFNFLIFVLIFPFGIILYYDMLGIKFLSNALTFALYVGVIPSTFNITVLFDLWQHSGKKHVLDA